MRKLLALLLVFSLVMFSVQLSNAQDPDQPTNPEDTEQTMTQEEAPVTKPVTTDASSSSDEATGFQMLKEKFIQGGWGFMLPILICLILGLALAIERVITLNLASVNTDKLLQRVDDRLKSGDVNGAMEICRSTPGPTASVMYEGLKNASYGPEASEKAIISYGSIQMNLLEKGLIWISLVIALAPMLGFFGTVIGMVDAFDNIERVGDISPTIVAGGIKVALLTTVFGLIVAMIMQVFYNYFISKIDGITHKMEEASVALVDMMVENNIFNKNQK